MLYSSPWSKFELTTTVVIGTDCLGSCKSNNHTITRPHVQTKPNQPCFTITQVAHGCWFGVPACLQTYLYREKQMSTLCLKIFYQHCKSRFGTWYMIHNLCYGYREWVWVHTKVINRTQSNFAKLEMRW
jgi:hypothetical protein